MFFNQVIFFISFQCVEIELGKCNFQYFLIIACLHSQLWKKEIQSGVYLKENR